MLSLEHARREGACVAAMHRLMPKLIVCVREGYSRGKLVGDLLAGITVAVIALPLAMAFGIASIPEDVARELAAIHPWLTPPAMGLFTAVIAGFLISALGGSRVQIGGPTGAFIVIVYGIAAQHGYAGLAVATLMAGVIVICMGLLRLGAMIKFIPYPVTTGFTAGIAVIIAASQVRDFLGLKLHNAAGEPVQAPPEFVHKVQVLAASMDTIDWATVGVGAGSLLLLIAIRKFAPRVPGAIVAVILSSAVVYFAGLETVETIGSRFGELPRKLPTPHLPEGVSWEMVRSLLPDAMTIAMLCAIESLLSAVVADGMTGYRHKSDCELIGQGVANIASAFFWGLPATGAIARTAANIKSGAKTPVAGMVHAVVLVLFMLTLAPLAKLIPLSALAAVLLMVAWNMSEIDHFRSLLKTPRSDVAVLLTTFGLTVFTDLTIAVGVGMVLASMLFMKRMAEVSNISSLRREMNGNDYDAPPEEVDPDTIVTREVPPDVEVFEINGPFFFGVADRLKDTLNTLERPPRVFVLRMRQVPAIDATGLHALEEFHAKCTRQGTVVVLSGVHSQPREALRRVGLDERIGRENVTPHIDLALKRAREVVEAGGAR